MPKTGRNDPCPCGSGQKYKRCCLEKDQAAEHQILAARRAELATLQAARQAELAALQAARQAEFNELQAMMQEFLELDDASNGVVDLVHAGRLDEAEQAARNLLIRYPEVPDGHDRLGMVYEARGRAAQAADCYRKVVDFMRAHPGDFDPLQETHFLERIAKLDPASGPPTRLISL
jgi:tetratricopeptide (TPR) repeat protein